MNTVADLREEYKGQLLDPSNVNPDPVKQFDTWFAEAKQAELPEPNAMSLATSTQTGSPSQRMVLLKAYDQQGFVFYTNYTSRKSQQIGENPSASALFPWIILARQVIIEGHVEKVSAAQSLQYFSSRPFGSQIGAWVSDQSEVISSRSILEQKWNEMKEKFKEGKIPLPDRWGGYRIIPRRIEFWQGQENRLHDRVLYTRLGEDWTWKRERLSP